MLHKPPNIVEPPYKGQVGAKKCCLLYGGCPLSEVSADIPPCQIHNICISDANSKMNNVSSVKSVKVASCLHVDFKFSRKSC